MNAIDFLKTLYFGDRYCTKFLLDSTNNKVELHVNQISRIRDKSGEWNYYTDEDIENGVLVFTGIKKCFWMNQDYCQMTKYTMYTLMSMMVFMSLLSRQVMLMLML